MNLFFFVSIIAMASKCFVAMASNLLCQQLSKALVHPLYPGEWGTRTVRSTARTAAQ